MQIFLIRHGESVDNVAGLYAGSRDSALTAHGVLQTRRLGSHLARSDVHIKHIFSSNLQRAVKTAEAVLDAQNPKAKGNAVELVQLTELREKDFGSGEGMKFGIGKSGDRKPHEGAETAEAMRVRADRFLDDHLFPILQSSECPVEDAACVVVAHGLILGTLFRAICARLLPGHLTLGPEVPKAGSEYRSELPVLPTWSNTGYLHGVFSPSTHVRSDSGPTGRELLDGKFLVKEVNRTDHLKGLKKTRGGIGSARFDDKQKSIDSFFGSQAKKRKADEATS
jgi:2,3-bisphosphoglycerate-dependent phosphoglycerate mutase